VGAKTADAPRIAAATYGTGDNENICRSPATVDARTWDFVAASSVGARAEWEGAWKAAAPATRSERESFILLMCGELWIVEGGDCAGDGMARQREHTGAATPKPTCGVLRRGASSVVQKMRGL
jgi:hypothetical protein